MKNFFYITTLLTLLYSCEEPIKSVEESPNFIFILADDLGYGEIGIQGKNGSKPQISTSWPVRV